MFIKNILIKQKSMCQSKSAHTLHIFTATQPQTLVICYCSCCGGSCGGMRVSLAIVHFGTTCQILRMFPFLIPFLFKLILLQDLRSWMYAF